jgi:hypothetical protein
MSLYLGKGKPAARQAKEQELGRAALARGLMMYRLTSGSDGWYAYFDSLRPTGVPRLPRLDLSYLHKASYDEMLAFFTDDLIFARYHYEERHMDGVRLRGERSSAEHDQIVGLRDWADHLRAAKRAEWAGNTMQQELQTALAAHALAQAERGHAALGPATAALDAYMAGGPHTQEEAAAYLAAQMATGKDGVA